MKKRFIVNILLIFILLSPIQAYANNSTISLQNNLKKDSIENSIEAYGESYDYEPEVTLEYKKEEQEVKDNTPKIGCKAAYVANPTTGKVFYEKNAHEKMYPASTTKILTALVVLEKCKLTDTAVVSKRALSLVPSGYSNANLKEGEELSILTLLQALLIPSANEAANVLAEHVSGSVEAFAELCNKRAKELGCEALHFVNPNGLHDENHYCSAYDLYIIAKECQKYDAFNEIVKTKSFTVPATKIYTKKDRTYTNTNSLILPNSKNYYYSYCTGIKTGHTTPAGECLVASSSNNNIDLISVVLGGGTNSKGLNERFYDTKQLFEFVYNNYSYKKIVDKKYVVATIDVDKATKDTSSLDVIINTDISTIVPNNLDLNLVTKDFKLEDKISAPIKQNQVLGYYTIKVDGLTYTVEMTASHTVEKIPYLIFNIVIAGVILLIIIILFAIIKAIKKRRM